MPAEGLLGASRLAPSGPPSLRSGVQRRCATLSNPACLSVGGSHGGQSTMEPDLRCLDTARGMPAEGFEPPTYGLQNRCTTTVLSRRVGDAGPIHPRRTGILPCPTAAQ